jgi:EAL domain-containing protein (putative c-di-GMP-specific phosphodiesterase class I)
MYRAAAGGPSEALPGLLGDLDGAVRRREFRLQYQPQVSALDGRTTGAESLLRWQHPQLGMISPDRFIELLEQSRLIVPLGAWILEESCRQLADWRRAGADWTISVNISSTQLLDPDFPAMVRAVLDRHGLPPQALTLELTETIGMQDPGATIPRLRQLSDLGVGISIDDFGTGYSSLLYLSTLPATELKIDRGFVRRLWEDSNDAYIVSTIVALGHALDLTVVAEGVESEEQRLFLSSVGCDVLQGYHLGVPLRPEHFWAQFGG